MSPVMPQPRVVQCVAVHVSLFSMTVLHDLFSDTRKLYTFFLSSILQVGNPRDTNM